MSDVCNEVTILQSAQARYRDGDPAEAAEQVVLLLTRRPNWAPAVRLLGLCRLKQGQIGEALALLQRAAVLTPGDPWAQVHLAMALLAAGQAEDAAPLLCAAADSLPDDPTPLINLVGALLSLKDFSGAVDAGREACRRAPQMAATQYVLGQALLATQDPSAADAFQAAVEAAPAFADAWVNLGVARYRSARMPEARAAMARALQASPRHRAALSNLAAFQRLAGQSEEAEALLSRALAEDPGAVGLRLNLAAILLQEERPEEALEVLGEDVPPAAHERQAMSLQRSLALLQLARFDAAQACMDALGPMPPDLAPLKAWREVLLAMSRQDEAAARAKALETWELTDAAGEALLPEHAIMCRFDLARFWHTRGEHDRAMEGWRTGHAMLARFQPFSRERHSAYVNGCIETLDAARLHYGSTAADRDPSPVFIVGMPRSGTTLAEQILAAHSQAHGAGERPTLGRAAYALAGAPDSAETPRRLAALDQPALDRAAQVYLSDLHALAPEARRIVDKMPGNVLHLGLCAVMLPGARIIHCVRDPRDTGLSIFTFRFQGMHAYAHDLADLGWYIGQQHRLMEHWKATLPNPILTLRLTDWIDDFDATLRRVLNFLELPFEEGCARFYENEGLVRTVSRHQVRQPINAHGLGRWRPYAKHLEPLIDELRRAGLCPEEEVAPVHGRSGGVHFGQIDSGQ